MNFVRTRVLTVHGYEDESFPYEDGLEFAMIIINDKIQFVEGADHGYTSNQAEITSIVLPFIKGIRHKAFLNFLEVVSMKLWNFS